MTVLPVLPATGGSGIDSAALAVAPIGVFDSGVGGLSILRHIRQQLPQEDLVYVADTAHAPYGEREEATIAERSLAIGAVLQQRGVKALVVACNTATAAAITALRQRYPELLVVGVEPGLKPAALASRSRMVGVMATGATLASQRFLALREAVTAATAVGFTLQSCPGLAARIEEGALDAPALRALLTGFIEPLLASGADTLVLGCTHYPLVLPQIEAILTSLGRADIACIDTGAAVARQLARGLAERHLLREETAAVDDGRVTDRSSGQSISQTSNQSSNQSSSEAGSPASGRILGLTSGDPAILQQAFARLLQWQIAVAPLT